jgi:uncharacterized membrane protein YczE
MQLLKTFLRYLWIMTGIFIMANGIVLVVQAQIGVSPWDVLHLGISYQTGITLGRVLQGVGLFIVLISWALHVKPSFVTLVNMFSVGFFVDMIVGLNYVPSPQALWLKSVCYLLGVAACGFGTAFYISGNGGAGPRDNLMLSLTKVTPLRVGVVRTLMEVTVAVVGYLLGGPLGGGTVLFALLVGVFMELGFAGIKIIKHSPPFNALWFETENTAGIDK